MISGFAGSGLGGDTKRHGLRVHTKRTFLFGRHNA